MLPLVQKFTVEPKEVMRKYKLVVVVGASKNPEKEANTVPAYLVEHGYTIVPVNPTTDSVLGLKAYPSLAEIPVDLAKKVEVVDVFRPSGTPSGRPSGGRDEEEDGEAVRVLGAAGTRERGSEEDSRRS